MKLKIPFDEIKDAIDQASYEHHYLMDKKNHEIVFISELESDYEEKLEECEGDDFISIEGRMPDENFRVMQSFVYKIRDFNLARKFQEALERKKPFRNFKDIINRYPKLREEWFMHKDKELANAAMDWLCINDIELADKSFMPKIEIKELKPHEVCFPEGFEGFGAVGCMKCRNKEGIKSRYFELNIPAENMLIDKEIKRIMKEKYGIRAYGCIGGGKKEILTFMECPRCRSNDIFEDF